MSNKSSKSIKKENHKNMDKKENFLKAKKVQNLISFLTAQFHAAIKDDVKSILSEGPIELMRFPFGQQPYSFKDVEPDNESMTLYCHKAYLNDYGQIAIEAGATKDPSDVGYELWWENMTQDEITLSDFLDCIYDNKDLRYENENDFDLNGPGSKLESAATAMDIISEACAYDEEHQDIVNFIADYAEEIRKWKEVKRLVSETDKDWEDAVEEVKPYYFAKR